MVLRFFAGHRREVMDATVLKLNLAAANQRYAVLHAEIDAFLTSPLCFGKEAKCKTILAISTANRGRDMLKSAGNDLGEVGSGLFGLGVLSLGLEVEDGVEVTLQSVQEEIELGTQFLDLAQK